MMRRSGYCVNQCWKSLDYSFTTDRSTAAVLSSTSCTRSTQKERLPLAFVTLLEWLTTTLKNVQPRHAQQKTTEIDQNRYNLMRLDSQPVLATTYKYSSPPFSVAEYDEPRTPTEGLIALVEAKSVCIPPYRQESDEYPAGKRSLYKGLWEESWKCRERDGTGRIFGSERRDSYCNMLIHRNAYFLLHSQQALQHSGGRARAWRRKVVREKCKPASKQSTLLRWKESDWWSCAFSYFWVERYEELPWSSGKCDEDQYTAHLSGLAQYHALWYDALAFNDIVKRATSINGFTD